MEGVEDMKPNRQLYKVGEEKGGKVHERKLEGGRRRGGRGE